jgi:hypothetical protein
MDYQDFLKILGVCVVYDVLKAILKNWADQ